MMLSSYPLSSHMSWDILLFVSGAWIVIGLCVASLFGRFAAGIDLSVSGTASKPRFWNATADHDSPAQREIKPVQQLAEATANRTDM